MPDMTTDVAILKPPCCFVGWCLTSKPWVPVIISFRLRKSSKVLLLHALGQKKKATKVFLQAAQGSQVKPGS